MSVPSNFRVGPFTTLTLIKKRYILFYIFLMWVSLFSIQLEFWWYWTLLFENKFVLFITYLPILVFVMYLTLVGVSLILAKILLVIVNLFHKPREGVFLRHPKDKDYCYWSIRHTIKKWPIWLAHKFPFPFLDNICLKMFGIRTRYSNSLFEGWVDTEFIQFGKEVVVGQGSVILSAIIVGNLFIMRKIIIGDNVRIGTHSVVMPGARIGNNCILAASSTVSVGQELEEGWIYLGAPAKKYKPNVFHEDGIADKILQQGMGSDELYEKYEELYTKRKDKEIPTK
jgi:carbonic anhydrase/acetyltransferase-like protein (isoleucine patch superfamily)